ncbi:MAG: ABC transporter [Bacteroidetes bacterium]|nr:ABC transporter [Bacteroidota bacterium]MDE2671144.1 ABC transporter [Bacteroidota bacterium]
MKEWKWEGSRWWKFDFHTHTPASRDYGKGPDQSALQKRTPREWLLDYMRAGIDCVAITDHNSGDWIDRVKDELDQLIHERPEGFRPIYVFPGVEISVYGGVHLLAILGCDKKTADIDTLLGKVGYNGEKGSSDAVTSLSLPKVIEEVNSVGAIAIPAHVDKDAGLFEVVRGNTLEQVLDGKNIFAMELVNSDYEKPQIYVDKKLGWTEVLGSDSHHPSGNSQEKFPGSHFAWVKMGAPSIEGLRLALLDGSLSVIRSDGEEVNPNERAKKVLESVEVLRARYLGRAEPFRIGFNPWLNSIIGGRGTGKSTIIEFLRIALRRTGELPGSLRKELEKYGEVYLDRRGGGLVTKNTTIKTIYRKDDSRFRIQWDPDGNLESIEKEVEAGQWTRAEGDIRQRFPVRIYSQKQVFDLASEPLALLSIVDEAPTVNRRAWDEKWRSAERKFLSLRARSRELESRLSEEPRLLGELEDVKSKQKIFERAGYANVLKNLQRLRRQERSIEAWEESWVDVAERLKQVANEIVPDPIEDEPFNMELPADAELQSHVTMVRKSLDELSNRARSLALQANTVLAQWRKNRDESAWKQGAASTERAYQTLQKELAQEGGTDALGYGKLIQDRQLIEKKLKEIEASKEQIKEYEKQTHEQLRIMHETRRELTKDRQDFLHEVLNENQYVRIRVVPYGAADTVEAEFRQLLQKEGSSFEKDIGSPDGEGLLGNLYKGDNSCGETIEERLVEIKSIIRNLASSKGNFRAKDQRFSAHVSNLNPEAIDRIDAWFPEDSLDVQYNATGEGENFLSIEEGSPGQKTAALLAFLLSYGDEPLILDQPEDDLDNLLIYDLIVTQLRSMKRHRQIIVVTHNANIVVNGDSELVVALAPCHGETKKNCNGSLQEKKVRETICTIMEGGSKAFEDRYRRIAPRKDDV